MNELKPVGYLSTDCIGEKFLCFSRPNDNDKCEELYAIPDTHRVVSVELLTTIEKAFVDYEMAVGDAPPYPHLKMMKELRAIIDSKGQE